MLHRCRSYNLDRSLSSRRAWIEIKVRIVINPDLLKSLSSRRAWIEINIKFSHFKKCFVALLTESVDWNLHSLCYLTALYKVALLTESVDWNKIRLTPTEPLQRSLSSRRAWIEMPAEGRPRPGGGGRSPHGERGLKLSKSAILSHFFGRSPHGERGLKFL